ITVQARAEALGQLRNTASVTTSTPLTPASRTLAAATTTITPGPHSRILLDDTAGPRRIPSGGTATFTPTVSNPNPWPMHDAKVCDRPPPGTKYAAGSADIRPTGRTVCWTIATLPAHKSRSVWVRVEPLLGVAGPVRDAATATAQAGDRQLTAHANATVL